MCHKVRQLFGRVLTPASMTDKRRCMPVCKQCGEEADELVTVRVDNRSKKLCESCAEDAQQETAIAQESEAVVQKMMDFKGRR